ncbi:MAG: glycosyltransferase family 2 protein [Melioribacteraceae bacterium]|nr:glycosyltransferase family 2 protein [Melioribacteraceae bacterium]
MYHRPKFSIVVPCYNGRAVIQRSLTSILSQTFIEFECLIINDASTDNTLEVISSFTNDERIRVVSLVNNSGVHAARNKGIEQARGEFILFLDCDDELFVNALEVFNDYILNNPDGGLFFANYITPNGKISGLKVTESGFVSYSDLICLKLSRELKPSIPLIKTDIAKRFSFKAPNTDFIFYRYVMRETKTYCMTDVLGKYNIEDVEGAMHIVRKVPNVNRSILRAKALDAFLNDFKEDYLKYCPVLYSDYSYGVAIGFLLDWNIVGAYKSSFEAMYYSNFKLKYTILFIFSIIPISPALLRITFATKRFLMSSK